MSVYISTKTLKNGCFWHVFGRFLRIIRSILSTFVFVVSELGIDPGVRDAGEGTEVGAEEAGCGDAALPAGRERKESDQWAAACGAAGAAYSGTGDRGEDGGEPFGSLRS